MPRLAATAIYLAVAAASPALAQQEGPAPGTPIIVAPFEDLTGWYEVTMKIPPTQCRLNKDAGGEWRAVVEATRGRRGLVLHLEQLKSWFTAPVLISVQPNGSFGYSGPAQVDLGAIVTQADFSLGGGVMADRQSFDGRFTVKHPFCSFEGTLSGKRTTAPPPPAPTEQPTSGLSVFTDSAVPYTPPPQPPAALGPSPLINGTYLTTLSVTESRCLGQDRRGRWNGTLELKPQPGIVIPLQDYGPIFGGPLILNVEGSLLKQTSSEIPLRIGPVNGPVPATFNGNFDADGSRFQVRFEAGTGFCRIGGTIVGIRS